MTFHLEVLARPGLYTHTVIILQLKTLGGYTFTYCSVRVKIISRAYATHRVLPLCFVEWHDP